MLIKVISGGQTGADIAGVRAAKKVGLDIGGTMPKGFRTLDGFRPEYRLLYNMVEHRSESYPLRTRENIINSDGTVRIASKFSSSGEKCTLLYLRTYKKPWVDIDRHNPLAVSDLADWINGKGISVLNVAGNSEQTSPGIEQFVEEYLFRVFSKILEA